MPAKITLNEVQLTYLFRDRNCTLDVIGEQMNCSRYTVAKAIKEYGLKRKYEDEEWLRATHHTHKKTIGDMAEMACCARDTIRVNMRKYNIETLDEVRYSGVRKYRVNYNYFDNINNAERAYWLGFILADGSIIRETTGVLRLSIHLAHKDRDHLVKFREAILSDAPIEDGHTFLNGKSHAYSKIRINSNDFCLSLMERGIEPHKSTREKVPTGIPEEFEKDFIRGYFDGDGCFSYWFDSKRQQFVRNFNVIGSQEIVDWIRDRISSKFKANGKVKPMGKIFRFDVNSEETEKVMNWLYEDADTYLLRKYDKYNEWLSLKHREDIVRPLVEKLES
ncbi:recombinase family protein_gp016 [Bacillus phage vB_BceM_WH1]|nr:recombinase family protein_gp016 [Bacillus phage vB_BceM_WH1]